MSRQEKYFHPVKNLLDEKTTEWLFKHFRKYEVGYSKDNEKLYDHEFFNYYESLGYKTSKSSYERVVKNIKTVIDMSHNWNSRKQKIAFYVQNNDLDIDEDIFLKNLEKVIEEHERMYGNTTNENTAVFHTVDSNPPLFIYDNREIIQKVIDLYEGENAVFLQTKGSGKTLTRHTDPKRKCVITFPLFPEYSEYRDCRYYDSLDPITEPEPQHTVNYKELRTPVLLNTQKIHEIGDDLHDKESLCFQIEWYDLDYITVRKNLSEKGLLTTTGY
jgi:hypothetical protein